MELNRELFIQSLREGIAGYLLMDATAAEIVAAVMCAFVAFTTAPEW